MQLFITFLVFTVCKVNSHIYTSLPHTADDVTFNIVFVIEAELKNNLSAVLHSLFHV